LCDIRSRSYNRTGSKEKIEDQAEIDEIVFRKGKRAVKINDDEPEPEQRHPKYTEIKKEQSLSIEVEDAV
jgi:hypothetical protein